MNLTSALGPGWALFPYVAPERYNGNDKCSCEAPNINLQPKGYCHSGKLAAKLCKASKDAYDHSGQLIWQVVLNEWVGESVASDPHEFSTECV